MSATGGARTGSKYRRHVGRYKIAHIRRFAARKNICAARRR
jgi:hypothetical protein